jgi:hypothetical protein
VNSTSVSGWPGTRPATWLPGAATAIGWLNLPIKEWTPELVGLPRDSGLQTMAFRVHRPGRARRAVRLGLDAMHGDDVDALLAAVAVDAAGWSGGPA